KMDVVEEVVNDVAAVNFRFQFRQQPGRYIVTMKDISKSYGSLNLLSNTSATIERGDKIALIGANGRGKSTLLRIVYGNEPIEGERTIGYNVIPAFYAQHQLEDLHVESEILEELKQAGSGKTEQELRNVLGCFLFSDEDVFKKIKVLSGGEKSRVALAKTLISEANFLLLDEPTNHLDFISENILIQALQQYQGSFITVSHNRHFVTQVANKIWSIEDRQIKEYPGTYEEYDYWQRSVKGVGAEAMKQSESKNKKKEASRGTGNRDNEERQRLTRDLRKVEAEIETLETELQRLKDKMLAPEVSVDYQKIAELQAESARVETNLAAANSRWDDLAQKIDRLNTDSTNA